MATHDIRAVVLAAGKSTRFKTKKSKLLFNICGRTMILYPLKVFEELNIPVTLVLGHQAEEICNEINCVGIKDITTVLQPEPKGTGHAVACARDTWHDAESVLILYGDMPLINTETINQLIEEHNERKATLTFLTSMMIDPKNYGRVSVEHGKYQIIEAKDCTPDQLQISCINAGVYLINRAWLHENISRLVPSPVSGEIYLTDLVKLAGDQGHVVHAIPVAYDWIRGVNTLQELWEVEQIKRSDFIKYWMANGVRFELAQSIHLDVNVKIGAGSFIGTGVHLLGNTTVGEESWIGAFTIIEDSTVGNNTMIHSHSVVQDSVIGNNVHVGPFARLRNNVKIFDNVDVGNFVELKRVTLGEKSKTKHLTYLGDATVGKSVNIGAGTIICNYDGVTKHKTIIEDEAFIGSNNTLIAPLKVGKGAYTAGGSTITDDVPSGSLAIGRAKQENKDGYVKKLLSEKKHRVVAATSNDVDEKQIHCDASGKSEALRFNFRGALKESSEKNNEGV